MIDTKRILSIIDEMSNSNPQDLLEHAVDTFLDIKKDGFTTLSAGNSEDGSKRVFTPAWSIGLTIFVSISLAIIVSLCWLTLRFKFVINKIGMVFSRFCSFLCTVVMIIPALFVRATMKNDGKATQFGLKISKVK